MTPWLDDGDVRLYLGDALETVRELPSDSVDCVVTSPPYWGLRDYGTGEWDGGDPGCDHQQVVAPRRDAAGGQFLSTRGEQDARAGLNTVPYRDVCGKCGARRVDRQMGLEPTPDLFVAGMVELFREIRRVLAPHGTCWINLGDSYAQSGGNGDQGQGGQRATRTFTADGRLKPANTGILKPKDLVGIPWRVAFALQADGWYLRSDIVWAKPNPMPESVTDRPTKSHEFVFLLTKAPRYWFDTEAVREPHRTADDARNRPDYEPSRGRAIGMPDGDVQRIGTNGASTWPAGGRNVRSVWQIATQPYPEAHFATYPEELARRCILAGCPTRVCRVCGKPSERIVERATDDREFGREQQHGATGKAGRLRGGTDDSATTWSHRTINGTTPSYRPPEVTTHGWTDCGCEVEGGSDAGRDRRDQGFVRVGDAGERRGGVVDRRAPDDRGADPAAPDREAPGRHEPVDRWRPGVVLDPFIGSGTTAKVARDHQRHAIGIDLNQEYLDLAARRLQQLSLLT